MIEKITGNEDDIYLLLIGNATNFFQHQTLLVYTRKSIQFFPQMPVGGMQYSHRSAILYLYFKVLLNHHPTTKPVVNDSIRSSNARSGLWKKIPVSEPARIPRTNK